MTGPDWALVERVAHAARLGEPFPVPVSADDRPGVVWSLVHEHRVLVGQAAVALGMSGSRVVELLAREERAREERVERVRRVGAA